MPPESHEDFLDGQVTAEESFISAGEFSLTRPYATRPYDRGVMDLALDFTRYLGRGAFPCAPSRDPPERAWFVVAFEA